LAKYDKHRAAPMADVSSAPWVDASPLTTELPHHGIIARLADFFEDSLSESDRRDVQRHLDHCPACRDSLESLKQTVHGVQTLPSFGAPPEAIERILKKARER